MKKAILYDEEGKEIESFEISPDLLQYVRDYLNMAMRLSTSK